MHWGVMGHTGMPWSVVAMGREGLGPAEPVVPSPALFTRLIPIPPWRETTRPHWSLGCPQSQQGMGGPVCPPVPHTGCPPSPPHYLPPGKHLHLLLIMPGEEEQRVLWIGPCWGWGWGTGVCSPCRPVASPCSEQEHPFCTPQPHSSKWHLAELSMQGPGAGTATRRAWGIQGLQTGRGGHGAAKEGHWGELVDPKGLGWGC